MEGYHKTVVQKKTPKGSGQNNIPIPVKKTFQKKSFVNGFKRSGLFPPNKKAVQHRILKTKSNDFSEVGRSILPSSNITMGLMMPPDNLIRENRVQIKSNHHIKNETQNAFQFCFGIPKQKEKECKPNQEKS